ncbi:flavodoxin [Shewanella sp. AS16]|uniref:flavodoxin n=1 Tax=Shewanella sp. AS16 TaxID=2907625 RepID=UPI001F28FF33|nr:flavodoxin [Shewanella sp. AS16]MCE9685112.1 flavodoxin [Shewanella sp. AS16]
MKRVNLVFGTVYGSAQFVAETLEQELGSLGYQARLWQPDELAGFVPPQDEYLILVCSTTGQGDLPDDIQPWFHGLSSAAPYLPELKYSVIALGDSSYETFCGAGKQLDSLFAELGATRLSERLEIDACETMEPELAAKAWLLHWHRSVESELAA